MSSEQPVRTRQTASGSPVGSTIAIVITIIAVVVGFFVLKKILDNDDSTSNPGTSTTVVTTVPGGSTTVASTAPPTTVFQLVKTGTMVQVANSSTINKVAGALTTALGGQGFTMCDATNGTTKTDTTAVQYDPAITGAKDVAASVAYLLGVADVTVLPTPVATQLGSMPAGCGVLVLLGNDKAGKTLAEMGGATTTTTAAAGGNATTTTKAP